MRKLIDELNIRLNIPVLILIIFLDDFLGMVGNTTIQSMSAGWFLINSEKRMKDDKHSL